MAVRRALVNCVVLSLQDTCVYYPSCEGCFSRINIHPTDTARCLKCGHSYLKEQVNYRYRLSLRVVKDTHIFGVTVFGSCLNSFFGIPASGLQRLVEGSEEQHGGHNQASLLVKAVKDCFVGRHLIFGIKVADSDRLFSPHSSTRPSLLGSNQEASHFIASQITLPCAAAPGCSVVSYYRSLLQHAVVNIDPCATFRPPPSSLLLLPSTPCSFNTTLPSCLFSPSQCHNNSLTPTPPWQQSLGVVTSSAEQDEGCSFEGDGGELTGRQRHAQRQETSVWLDSVGEKEHSVDRVSPPTSTCCPDEISWDGNSFWNLLPSYTASPESPVHRLAVHATITHTRPAPPVPVHGGNQPISNTVRESLDREEHVDENSRSLSDSVAWEDMPFSESIGEFVCEADGQLDRFHEKEPNIMKENGERNSMSSHCSYAKTSLIDSHDNSPSSPTSCDGALLDITNAALIIKNPNVSRSSWQTCRGLDPTESVFPVKAINPELTEECGQDSEQQLGAHDEYNCSADLFYCSQIRTDVIMSKTNSDPKGGPDTLDLDGSVDSALYTSECLHSPDFVPFSQSTPVGKRTGSVEVPFFRGSSHTHAARTHINNRQESKTDCSRHTPKAHTRTPWEPRQFVLAQQCLRVHKTTPKGAPKRRTKSGRVCDSSLSMFDIDTEIPPTCKVRRSVRLRHKSNSSCERALQDRATAHQQYGSGLKQRLIENYVFMDRDELGCSERKGSHERTATDPGLSLLEVSLHEKSDACDLSQDLFADSF
ncbi:DNA damage-induced apoptosis suppressor protein [Osmerus mordax]|uniref:DNA damage-induced apoptosis suppressor protein n=1 Tax=Osmerus mordax TaxID=8014 RepID=UPI0035100BE0